MSLQSLIPLATVTLSTASPSVTFSSVPQGYRDLVLICNVIGTGSALDSDYLKFNGSSSSFNTLQMYGTGSSYASNTGTSGRISNYENTLNRPYLISVNISDYSSTDKYKTYTSRFNSDDAGVGLFAGRWAQNAAVTSIEMYPFAGSYASGSTFNLYGRIG